MATNWKVELSAALRRLEAESPSLRGIRSFVRYGSSLADVTGDDAGAAATMALRCDGSSRPCRMILFRGDPGRIAIFNQHALDLFDVLDEVSHARIGEEWRYAIGTGPGWHQLARAGAPLSIGLISWTIAMHQFAKTASDVELMDYPNGSALLRPDEEPDKVWYPSGAYQSFIAEPATVAGKMADWIQNTDLAKCPIVLLGEGKLPVVMGEQIRNALTSPQYTVVAELVRAFPDGLSNEELDRNSGISDARFVLMRMVGKRQRIKRPPSDLQKKWASVILPPGGNTGMGWRLNRDWNRQG